MENGPAAIENSTENTGIACTPFFNLCVHHWLLFPLFTVPVLMFLVVSSFVCFVFCPLAPCCFHFVLLLFYVRS